MAGDWLVLSGNDLPVVKRPCGWSCPFKWTELEMNKFKEVGGLGSALRMRLITLSLSLSLFSFANFII